MKFRTLLISAGLLFAAQSAFAVPYAEGPDSGDSLGSAQFAGSADLGGSITGLGGTGDVDMYSFTWSGGGLYIDSFSPFTFDTQLFLFDAAGFGVLGNDDHGGACPGAAGSGLQSCLDLTGGGGLAAGTYYIAISAFNNDPLDGAATAMMSCAGFTTQCTSVGGPLASWSGPSGTPGSSAYSINFTVVAPEPSILILLGVGLVGLGFARRRRG